MFPVKNYDKTAAIMSIKAGYQSRQPIQAVASYWNSYQSSTALASGIRLGVPASDYRGFRLRRFSKEELARTNDFRAVELNGKGNPQRVD
jgi:hypothetical protein